MPHHRVGVVLRARGAPPPIVRLHVCVRCRQVWVCHCDSGLGCEAPLLDTDALVVVLDPEVKSQASPTCSLVGPRS